MVGLIRRGQVWIVDLSPRFGSEIHKRRPALIIANDSIHQNLRSTIVLPISSRVEPLGPEKILIPKNMAGLEKNSVIITLFIRDMDKTRLVKKVGKITYDKLEEVEDSLKFILGMTDLNM